MDYKEFINSSYYKNNTKDVKEPILDFVNKDLIYDCIEDILIRNKSVYVYGDYDADGVCSSTNWTKFFKKFGFNKYRVYEYRNRTHQIDKDFIRSALIICPDYVIINDAGSQDLKSLTSLSRNGIKVILLDHHMCFEDYSNYPPNVYVVNTTVENSLLGEKKYMCCTGALVYLLLKEFLDSRNLRSTDMAVIALASLYADCMLMSNDINRYVYYQAITAPVFEIPDEVRVFMMIKQQLSRRFFEFTWAPKINSAFRTEQLDVINKTILNRSDSMDVANIEVAYKTIHSESITLVNSVVDLIDVHQFTNFVYGNLNSVDKYINIKSHKLYNYTGLIANRLSSKYNKACVVVCHNGLNYKGSLRDKGGRDFLSVFKTFSDSNGHPPAFGIYVPNNGFEDFLLSIERVDKFYNTLKIREPLFIEKDSNFRNDELLSIALYNEFSSSECPRAFIKVSSSDLFLTNSRVRGFIYNYGTYKVKSDRRLLNERYVLIDVYYNGVDKFSLEVI